METPTPPVLKLTISETKKLASHILTVSTSDQMERLKFPTAIQFLIQNEFNSADELNLQF